MRSAVRSAPSQAGYSLIEMMAVVAILGVMTVLALLSLGPTLDVYRIKGDAGAIQGLISLARMRATADFAHASLICTAGTPSVCQVQVTTSGAATPVTEPTQQFLSSGVSFATTLPAAVGNQTVATQNTTMIFNSRGYPLDTAGNLKSDYALYLTDTSGRYYAIALQANGQPAIYSWSGKAWVQAQ